MSTPHVHAEVIKAWADGAEIEVLNTFSKEWEPAHWPAWLEELQYRVKPQLKQFWVNIYPDNCGGTKFRSKALADEGGYKGRIACVQVTYYDGDGL